MKKIIMILAVLAIGSVTLMSCAGTMYHQQRVLIDGSILTQGGRTGVLGTDNSFVYIQPAPAVVATPAQTSCPAPAQTYYKPAPVVKQPEKVLLERTYTKVEDGYKQKCPNPNQRHSFYHNEMEEKWTEEVLEQPHIFTVPPAKVVKPVRNIVQSAPVFGFGTNPSVGNLAIPTAIGAAGYVAGQRAHRPDNINVTGGGANANAEAASVSSSAANAEQNQNQTLNNSVDVEVD